jgi:hypothetical protein
MLSEVSRVLAPGGAFLLVSLGDPARRLCLLCRERYDWDVQVGGTLSRGSVTRADACHVSDQTTGNMSDEAACCLPGMERRERCKAMPGCRLRWCSGAAGRALRGLRMDAARGARAGARWGAPPITRPLA